MNVNLQEIINKLQTAKGELQKQQRFAQFATGLDKLISHTSEPLMLVVMGSFSTGKSSFINELLGEEIAAAMVSRISFCCISEMVRCSLQRLRNLLE